MSDEIKKNDIDEIKLVDKKDDIKEKEKDIIVEKKKFVEYTSGLNGKAIILFLFMAPILIVVSILIMRYGSKQSTSDYVFEFDEVNGLQQRMKRPIPSVETVTSDELSSGKLKHYTIRQLYSGMENAMRFLGKSCSTMHDYVHLGPSKKIVAMLINDGADFIPMINPEIVGNSTRRITVTDTSPYCKSRGKISVVYHKYVWVRFKLYRDFSSKTVKKNLEGSNCDGTKNGCMKKIVSSDGKVRTMDPRTKKINPSLNKYYVPSNQNKFFSEISSLKNNFIEMTIMLDDENGSCIQKIIREYVEGKTICDP